MPAAVVYWGQAGAIAVTVGNVVICGGGWQNEALNAWDNCGVKYTLLYACTIHLLMVSLYFTKKYVMKKSLSCRLLSLFFFAMCVVSCITFAQFAQQDRNIYLFHWFVFILVPLAYVALTLLFTYLAEENEAAETLEQRQISFN